MKLRQTDVIAHQRSFGYPGLVFWPRDSRTQWDAIQVLECVAKMMQEALVLVRGKPWEESFWECVATLGLPDDVVLDLIARKVAMVQLGHLLLPDSLLWQLADEVPEAVLTLSKRRYTSPKYNTDRFEEVLYAFPTHEWMLESLVVLEPDVPEKATRLAGYVRNLTTQVHNRVMRYASDSFKQGMANA